jgi:hypothetical protein
MTTTLMTAESATTNGFNGDNAAPTGPERGALAPLVARHKVPRG